MWKPMARMDRSKNSKFYYYLSNYLGFWLPNVIYRRLLSYQPVDAHNIETIRQRINYYHRWQRPFSLSQSAVDLNEFRQIAKCPYFFDLYRYMRLFPQAKFCYQFGDVRDVPDMPSFVKSRPIHELNKASILLNLNKVRHFVRVQDEIAFSQKHNQLVWRGGVHQPQRIRFFEQYFNHSRCNIGQTNRCKNLHFQKPRMTILDQLHYKFILSLEGNDVASNLKWIMSSNSLAVMPKPKFETWFMEGRLEPGVHYVCIRDDYADLEEKMDYYLSHPDEAEQICRNANRYVQQFQNPALENTIAMAVIERYLSLCMECSVESSHNNPFVRMAFGHDESTHN
ncbi:glycosyl transferase family 90 [Celerinatantimonas yamalensis]|uniref:Glycosyl transferase family 90 n=1 Tax=Celerinatantimonas yamalensis TaxID=559956 RepID=A0ABW9GBA6_9GAMM